MQLQIVKCLSRNSESLIKYRTPEQNRFKVQASLDNNEKPSDLIKEVKDRVQKIDFNLAQDLQIKSGFVKDNVVTAVFEPKTKTRLSNKGLKILSKTCNIFRDDVTDGTWKEVKGSDGRVKYIRVQNENLAELIKTNANLKMTAYVVNMKTLKPGDLIVYVSTKGNMEVAIIISDDFAFNIVQNKVVKLSSISSDDITNYKSNEDSAVEELNNSPITISGESDLQKLQGSLTELKSTVNLIRKKQRSSKLSKSKADISNDVKNMKKILSNILNNPIQQKRNKQIISCIVNF